MCTPAYLLLCEVQAAGDWMKCRRVCVCVMIHPKKKKKTSTSELFIVKQIVANPKDLLNVFSAGTKTR
jgi:hypothetical protein